jgi:UDP-N-acetylglucosamine:LPS N-acetylglucosamine transferase
MIRDRALRVEIVYFNAGGGHRAAALALKEALGAFDPTWRVELVQLQELLQSLDPLYQAAGLHSEELYNLVLKRGWTYGSETFLRVLQKGISIEAPAFKRRLRDWWADRAPDLVVSVVPNFNRVMYEALQLTHPATPFVTIMTDFADVPPNFWMEPQDQYLVCGTRKAALQAALSGFYRPERIFEVSGMIIRPRFYAALAGKPKLTREEIGLDPHGKVALVMFGGYGSEESTEVIDQLGRRDVACILMCGRNEKLFEKYRDDRSVHAVAFTEQVEEYMRLADFFVGKPGPGSVSEALLMGLPVIVTSNSRTMIQERYNVTWVEEKGVGIGVANHRQLDEAVRYLLDGNRLEQYRGRAAALANRAIFEIPPLLKSIVDGDERGAGRKEIGFSARWDHPDRIGYQSDRLSAEH